ncbi:TraB/GumN family protein [Actimicrobium antarcticum]|uniref:TraB/GumN family protein n=1 Tax=Actimicrobium antarcticum TaxID=1051899 RepID=A0ABP7T6W5_9BURK
MQRVVEIEEPGQHSDFFLKEFMRRTLMVITMITLFLFGWWQVPALAEPAVAVITAAQSAAQPIPRRGTLYRITQPKQHGRPGHTAWLFGTVHVGNASFYPLEPTVMQALARAGTLVLELDPADQPALQAAFARHGLLPAPQTIDRVVSPSTFAQLQPVLTRLGVPLNTVTSMKPWAIANVLLAVALEQAGYARELGIEVHLLAKAAGKPVLALESADYQLGLFDTLDASQQEQYLRECLESITSGKMQQQARAMMNAWGRADGAMLEHLLRDELAETTVTADFARRILLGQRNPVMAQVIGQLMAREASSFVAIGLLHLVGEDGVPALLARRGYRVEKVY